VSLHPACLVASPFMPVHSVLPSRLTARQI
jgi:hypothetical protein